MALDDYSIVLRVSSYDHSMFSAVAAACDLGVEQWAALVLNDAMLGATKARPATAEDVRLMVREEIRAALGEIARLRPDLAVLDEAAPLTREVVERASRMQSALEGPTAKYRNF